MDILSSLQKIVNLQGLKGKIPAKPFLASMIGGGIVLYDFSVFGFLASVFSPLFFPAESKFSALLLGYATFAVGYLCNPIGAIIFGHIGDRYGRRVSLSWSLWLMGISTLIMGILPTYSSIGMIAPILMVIARMIQGVANGGESNCCYIYAMEHSDRSVYGLSGGLFNSGSFIGIFLGSFAGYICTLPEMPIWTWRIPFLLGFIVVLFGIQIRKNIDESPEYAALKEEDIERTPLLQGLAKNKLKFFWYILFIGFPGVAFHVNFIYLPTFLSTLPGITDNFSRLCITLATICSIIMMTVFGYYSDIKFSKAALMKIASILLAIFAVVMFYNVYHLGKLGVLLYLLISATLAAMFDGPSRGFEMKVFDVKHRCSCVSLGYQIAIAVICGTAPLISALLVSLPSGHLWLAGYLFVWAIIGYFSVQELDRLSSNNGSVTMFHGDAVYASN